MDYRKEDRTIKSLQKTTQSPLSYVALLIRVRREREKRARDFALEKEPLLLQLREIEEKEKKHCEGLEQLEKEIREKLLTMKKEGLIIETKIEANQGKVVFAQYAQVEGPSEKTYRDNPAYQSIPDRFFMLNVSMAKKAVEGGLSLPFFSKEERTTIRVYTGK